MSKVLCTFSGKFGDILWSLPTVRAIAKKHGHPVTMGVMPQYESLCAMLREQPYIDHAIPIKDWICVGSPHGDQPWEAPVEPGLYDHVYHLTYRRHPSGGEPVVDFIAAQQGIKLEEPVVPFIFTPKLHFVPEDTKPVVAYSFNEMYHDQKSSFLERLKSLLAGKVEFVDVGRQPWTEAVITTSYASAFVGCRSACWVLAVGCGKQTFTYEPHPARHMGGMFGKTFGCPYGPKEVTVHASLLNFSTQAAEVTANMLETHLAVEQLKSRKDFETVPTASL